MESISVLFIDGPLDGQYGVIKENKDKEYYMWQRQRHFGSALAMDEDDGTIITKIIYKASDIDSRFYFLHIYSDTEEKPKVLFEQMKTVLAFVKTGMHGIGIEQAISVLKQLALCDNFKAEWRKEIIDLYENATLKNTLTAHPGA